MTPDAAFHLRVGIREAGAAPGVAKVVEIAQLALEAGLRVAFHGQGGFTRAGYVREVEDTALGMEGAPPMIWVAPTMHTGQFDWVSVPPSWVLSIDFAEEA